MYTLIANLIKKEVQTTVNDSIKDFIKKDCISDIIRSDIIHNDASFIKQSIENDYLNNLIISQQKEIEFLRNELSSKDKLCRFYLTIN